jgi:hypothetical protein
MDLEGKGWARGAVVDRYPKGLAVEGMPRIDDRDGLDELVLAVFAPWGIKKIPRSTRSPRWCANSFS